MALSLATTPPPAEDTVAAVAPSVEQAPAAWGGLQQLPLRDWQVLVGRCL
jgi:hypothetical protein